MRDGKAITVAPIDQLLTTQQAADFLGISRPTLVKLLESDEIPHESPGAGRHRRVRLRDVLDYQERKRSRRRLALDELTQDAVGAGLYEAEQADYADALRLARRGEADVSRFCVLLDACVLVPISRSRTPCDAPGRGCDLCPALWSARLLDEMQSAIEAVHPVAGRRSSPQVGVIRWRRFFEDALVEGW